MQDVLGSLFTSVIFLGFINFQMIIPTFLMERPVMNRERASRLYSVLPWTLSMEDVEIPWIVVQVRAGNDRHIVSGCCSSFSAVLRNHRALVRSRR